ncbi:pyridoxal-phosphate dependent enzyme [Agromyces silvae]|uniref:pyridoxal-phosphate dependent enzyme n=1 Tax=Agromyces silvae TaxID=3388266 RepID=UPI00280A667C|nr:pyridoxal-phosphate dependent enzyme [Agromyces protaetiae]
MSAVELGAPGIWRYADRLPAVDAADRVSLGEGGTPLLDVSATLGRELGLGSLRLKAEDRNPTGSFKARIAAVAASLVRTHGLHGLVGTSSGNGGAAAAAYAAAAGRRAVLFTLSDTLPVKMLEITATGGVAYRVHGVGHDAASTRAVADAVAAAAERAAYYPMLTGYHYAPEAMRGVETIAWEVIDDGVRPTAVYAPVGGGGLLTGLHRGFARVGAGVRLVGVHPAGATALPLALEGRLSGMPGAVETGVSGLQMAVLYDAVGASTAVEQSGGHTTAVSDERIHAAQARLAHAHGLLVEPAGATAVAGVIADAESGRLGPDDDVVAVLSGAGYKDTSALQRLATSADVPIIAATDVGGVLARLGEEHA